MQTPDFKHCYLHFSLNSEKHSAAERCKSTLSEKARVQRLVRWPSLMV